MHPKLACSFNIIFQLSLFLQVNLGVLMENENTSEGIYNIMHHMHQYVPGHDTDNPTTIVSAGDLLTCERESNCIEEQRNSSTPSRRLEGLMPAIADFHALANYFQVYVYMYLFWSMNSCLLARTSLSKSMISLSHICLSV